MTREEFNNLLLQADREFALQKRLFERWLNAKYSKIPGMSFLTESGRTAYLQQLQIAKDAELHQGLANIWGDIEAKTFGMRGKCGWEKTLPPTHQMLLVPTNPNQPISLNHSINNHEESSK